MLFLKLTTAQIFERIRLWKLKFAPCKCQCARKFPVRSTFFYNTDNGAFHVILSLPVSMNESASRYYGVWGWVIAVGSGDCLWSASQRVLKVMYKARFNWLFGGWILLDLQHVSTLTCSGRGYVQDIQNIKNQGKMAKNELNMVKEPHHA